MLNNIYFSKRVGYALKEADDIYFHAMFSLLEYAGVRNDSLMDIMYNTRCYLVYDLLENQSELTWINSYQLLSYGLGLYFEQFCFRNADNFKHYLLRNIKMRLSVPLVKINMHVPEIEAPPCQHIYMFCAGYNESNDELIIIYPYTNQYKAIPLTEISRTEYEFLLLNFPDIAKPKMIQNYRNRILHYYDTILRRKMKQSRWLIGYEAIQHMQHNGIMHPNLEIQLDILHQLNVEV